MFLFLQVMLGAFLVLFFFAAGAAAGWCACRMSVGRWMRSNACWKCREEYELSHPGYDDGEGGGDGDIPVSPGGGN